MNKSVLTMYTKLKKELESSIKSNEEMLQYHRGIVKKKKIELKAAQGAVAGSENKLGLLIEQLGHVTQQIMEGKGDPTLKETSEELITRLKTRMELLLDSPEEEPQE